MSAENQQIEANRDTQMSVRLYVSFFGIGTTDETRKYIGWRNAGYYGEPEDDASRRIQVFEKNILREAQTASNGLIEAALRQNMTIITHDIVVEPEAPLFNTLSEFSEHLKVRYSPLNRLKRLFGLAQERNSPPPEPRLTLRFSAISTGRYDQQLLLSEQIKKVFASIGRVEGFRQDFRLVPTAAEKLQRDIDRARKREEIAENAQRPVPELGHLFIGHILSVGDAILEDGQNVFAMARSFVDFAEKNPAVTTLLRHMPGTLGSPNERFPGSSNRKLLANLRKAIADAKSRQDKDAICELFFDVASSKEGVLRTIQSLCWSNLTESNDDYMSARKEFYGPSISAVFGSSAGGASFLEQQLQDRITPIPAWMQRMQAERSTEAKRLTAILNAKKMGTAQAEDQPKITDLQPRT